MFEPLTSALLEKHITDRLFHGDETRWQVFQVIEGKIGYRWSLWLTCSATVVYFGMVPVRGTKVIKEHLAGLPPDVPIIFVCDRYRAYQCWAKDFPLIRLAFCWAHLRRDFLDAAKAWPLLAVWMHSWVETIGELYHLNDQLSIIRKRRWITTRLRIVSAIPPPDVRLIMAQARSGAPIWQRCYFRY